MKLKIDEENIEFKLSKTNSGFKLDYNNNEFEFELVSKSKNKIVFLRDGKKVTAFYHFNKKSGDYTLVIDGQERVVASNTKSSRAGQGNALDPSNIISPMPGKIFKILKNERDEVKSGDTVMVLEAMKMEHSLKAQADGKITKIHGVEGSQVTGGQVLVELEVSS